MTEPLRGRRLGWALVALAGTMVLAVVLAPGLASGLPVTAVVALVGNDYFLVGLFGLVGLFLAGWMVARRARERTDRARPPDPETVPGGPRPGDRVDELLNRWHGRLDADERAWLRRRLRAQAVRAEMREGLHREAAVERVEGGAWTNDSVAARYLAADAEPSTTRRLRLALRGTSWAQYGARATVAALLAGRADG